MPFALLEDRTLVTVSGPDAEHFLQNIVTTDLDQLVLGQAKPGALLTPQGKILFDFLISCAGGSAFRLECRAEVADDFVRRLMLYRLRAKAEIAKADKVVVTVRWDDGSAASQSDSGASQTDSSSVSDMRFADAVVTRQYGQVEEDPASGQNSDFAAWKAFRIAHGIAESGTDYQLGDAFPHDVLLDETGGVGFRKGCYVGQEVVSRMQHRGTARRRVLIVSADDLLPPPGAEITAAGKPLGTLGSVADTAGLAIVRIDRVKDALDSGLQITAGGVPLTLSIPRWAKFTFPREAAGAEDA